MSDSTASAGGSSSKHVPKSTPLIFTKNGIPTLTKGLDASDVLECYALVRRASLHGLGDGSLTVQKMAIGVRYRPATTAPVNKVPMELTLEYGPQRMGAGLQEESLPFVVQVEDKSGGGRRESNGGGGTDNSQDLSDSNDGEGTYSHLTWENEGRVYYTREISPETYSNAYYMASMTGAVLDTLLRKAIDYTQTRRRYQPFSIYINKDDGEELGDKEAVESSPTLKMKSSSSIDFAYYVWEHLVDLGVEVEPILEPPVYEARLHVTDIRSVQSEPAVTNQAAAFHQRLYQCVEAIATNDHSRYTSAPTKPPSPVPTEEPVLSPTIETLDADSAPASGTSDNTTSDNATLDGDGSTEGFHNDEETGHANDGSDGSDSDHDGDRWRNLHDSTGRREDRDLDSENLVERKPVPENPVVPVQEISPSEEDSETPGGASEGGESLDNDNAGTDSSSSAATPSSAVQDVKDAAEEAQAKADEAASVAQTEGDTKSANAAQAAADAASKAAVATMDAAAKAAMDGLLSGDGAVMSSIISTCFSNPMYGISVTDKDGTLQVPAYLYKDGSRYYQMNMTSPFVEVVKVHQPIPKPVDTGKGMVGGGDMVDWIIAWIFFFGLILGGAMLLQQLGYKFFGPLIRCQRWYFHPRKMYRDDSDDEIGENNAIFGEDAIPLSMGGRATMSPVRPLGINSSHSNRSFTNLDMPEFQPNGLTSPIRRSPLTYRKSTNSMSQDDFGDLELQQMGSNGSIHSIKRKHSDGDSLGSMDDDNDESEFLSPTVPIRFMRDPDLVDLPDLKSLSKVAVPVGVKARQSNSFSSDDA